MLNQIKVKPVDIQKWVTNKTLRIVRKSYTPVFCVIFCKNVQNHYKMKDYFGGLLLYKSKKMLLHNFLAARLYTLKQKVTIV